MQGFVQTSPHVPEFPFVSFNFCLSLRYVCVSLSGESRSLEVVLGSANTSPRKTGLCLSCLSLIPGDCFIGTE